MDNIIIGTTPTITYTFNLVSPAEITVAIFTVKCGARTIITKTLADATVGEKTISWTLSQQETLSIGTRGVKLMLNWKTADGTRGASKEVNAVGIGNHVPEVI